MSISVEMSQLKDHYEKLKNISREGKQKKLLESCAKELAVRLLKTVEPKTPVVTGYLKSHWKYGDIGYDGDIVTVTVSNPVEYASHAEHGHRIVKNGKTTGLTRGKHFLDISVREIRSIAPTVLENKIAAFLEEIL